MIKNLIETTEIDSKELESVSSSYSKSNSIKARVKHTNQIFYFKKGIFEYLGQDGNFYKNYELEFL